MRNIIFQGVAPEEFTAEIVEKLQGTLKGLVQKAIADAEAEKEAEKSKYITSKEAERVLNVTAQTLRNWRKRGVLNAYQPPNGGKLLYLRSEIYGFDKGSNRV